MTRKRNSRERQIEIFWSRVDKEPRRLPETREEKKDCWLWRGARSKSTRYGKAAWEGKVQNAHRVAWQIVNGPVPDGLFILHRCDNPPCVNPDHLRAGTHQENIGDAVKRDRMQRGDRHYNAKLSERKAMEIRALRAGGKKTSRLARMYGVTEATINGVIRGRVWKKGMTLATESGQRFEQKSEGPPVAADEPSVKPTDIACEWGDSNSHGGKPTGS